MKCKSENYDIGDLKPKDYCQLEKGHKCQHIGKKSQWLYLPTDDNKKWNEELKGCVKL